MGQLDEKVAVITGGSSGIGRAATLRFLQEGAKVVFGDLDVDGAAGTRELAATSGLDKNLRFIEVDVAKEHDVKATIDLALEDFGRLDCVFNNAGILGVVGDITEITEADWDSTVRVLLNGVFFGIKHGAHAIKAHGEGGTIINTASVAALSGGAGAQAYSAAKAAVVNLTMSSAVELAAHRIRVNAICPGAILTGLMTKHIGISDDHLIPFLRNIQPWPDHGAPEYVSGVALFLASRDSTFVTGQTIVVDGGMTAAGPNMRQV